jgi:hypothetical protein
MLKSFRGAYFLQSAELLKKVAKINALLEYLIFLEIWRLIFIYLYLHALGNFDCPGKARGD